MKKASAEKLEKLFDELGIDSAEAMEIVSSSENNEHYEQRKVIILECRKRNQVMMRSLHEGAKHVWTYSQKQGAASSKFKPCKVHCRKA